MWSLLASVYVKNCVHLNTSAKYIDGSFFLTFLNYSLSVTKATAAGYSYLGCICPCYRDYRKTA